MKLRIKLLHQPLNIHRVTVPEDADIATLAEAVRGSIQGCGQTADILFSLNKQTPLSHDPSTPLKQLGVRSGDTVWVHNTPPPATSATDTALSNSSTPQNSVASTAPANSNPQKRAHPHEGAALPVPLPGIHRPLKAGLPSDNTAGVNNAQDDDSVTQHEALHQALSSAPVATHTPTYLLRVLSAWATRQHVCGSDAARPAIASTSEPCCVFQSHQFLLWAVQAALAERGFCVATTAQSTQQPSQDTADHTVVNMDIDMAAPAISSAGMQLPRSGVLSLRYTYARTHTMMPELDKTSTSTVALCVVKAIAAGPCLVVHFHVKQPPNVSSANKVLSLDTRVHIAHVPAAPSVATSSEGNSNDAIATVLKHYQDLRQLWVQVQDWVTTVERSTCQAVGIEPRAPAFMTLPLELKLMVLRKLKAHELARVTCTCTALHDLGGENTLWEPLFYAEFSSAFYATRSIAAQKGFQTAFSVAYEMRKHREQPRLPWPSSTAPMHFFRHPQPFMPVGAPIIGGDYDRFPLLPPLGMSGPAPGFGVGRSFGTQGQGGFSRYPGTANGLHHRQSWL